MLTSSRHRYCMCNRLSRLRPLALVPVVPSSHAPVAQAAQPGGGRHAAHGVPHVDPCCGGARAPARRIAALGLGRRPQPTFAVVPNPSGALGPATAPLARLAFLEQCHYCVTPTCLPPSPNSYFCYFLTNSSRTFPAFCIFQYCCIFERILCF